MRAGVNHCLAWCGSLVRVTSLVSPKLAPVYSPGMHTTPSDVPGGGLGGGRYGGTDAPHDPALYDHYKHISKDVLALVDHVGHQTAVIVGHDW
jgi:pimeloyl-ACP methyl ester carboxylesterase